MIRWTFLATLVLFSFTILSCSDQAYKGITWSDEGIVGVDELEETTRETHYYLFKRSFFGSVEEIQEIRMAHPSEDPFAIRGWKPIEPFKEGLISYQLLLTSGVPAVDPNSVSMVHGRPGPTGVLVYYTTSTGVVQNNPREATLASFYANTSEVRSFKYQGLEGAPIADRFRGTHTIIEELQNGKVKAESRFDATGEPFDPYFLFPHRIEYSYGAGKEVSRKAFDKEGKPASLSARDCHEIRSEYTNESISLEKCFDKDGKAVPFGKSSPYFQIKYTYGENYVLVQYLDEEGKPAFATEEENYTDLKRTGLPAQKSMTLEFLNRKGNTLPDVNRIETSTGGFGELLEYSCWNNEKATACEQGWHKHTRKYENGYIVEAAFIATDGNLFEDENKGFARRTWKQDKEHRVIEVRSHNANDELAGKPNLFAPVEISEYSNGQLVQVRFLNAREEPGSHPDTDSDHYIQTFEYPEPGIRISCHLDQKEKPHSGTNGASCEKIVQNAQGWPEEFYLLDEKHKPVTYPRINYHKHKFSWDDRGYITNIKYFDKEGKPMHVGQFSVHEIRIEYTPFGATSEEAFFDRDGNPAENGLGTHRTERFYEEGRFYRAKLYDKDGRLTNTFNY